MRITHVRAENFRSLRQVDLELAPLTVVVGPNGAGKSSLLELLHLFAGIENPGHLNASFARWGGYYATLYYGASDPTMKLGISMADTKHRWDYDIEFSGDGRGCYVRTEHLRRTPIGNGNRSGHPVKWDPRPVLEEFVLFERDDRSISVSQKEGQRSTGQVSHSSNTEVGHIPDVESFISHAKLSSLWPVYRFQPGERVRAPQQLQPADTPSLDGGNLFSALYELKTERRATYETLLDELRSFFPELGEIEFPLAGAGHVNLTWKQSNFSQPFYSNQLSDGTLRLLWLATILHTVPDDGLVLIDEPEISLHPQWLMLLVSMFRKTSARATLVVATQSAELIRWLQPEELVIANLTESGTTITPAKAMANLDKWLKDFTLAELWTMGELGGRR